MTPRSERLRLQKLLLTLLQVDFGVFRSGLQVEDEGQVPEPVETETSTNVDR